jgi:aminomethyltransferase
MRYPLYGNDIDEHHTPLEAGLGWIVKLDTGFIGEEALRRQAEEGPAVRLCGFELIEPGIVRDGCPVHLDGRVVGRVTSGGYAPSLEKSIGLVYLPADRTATGTPLTVDIRGKMRRAKVVETPFYRKPK